MAKINHIAIFSNNPSKLAEFYTECFGMTITGQSNGDVWITEGYVDVALIRRTSKPYRTVSITGVSPSNPTTRQISTQKCRNMV